MRRPCQGSTRHSRLELNPIRPLAGTASMSRVCVLRHPHPVKRQACGETRRSTCKELSASLDHCHEAGPLACSRPGFLSRLPVPLACPGCLSPVDQDPEISEMAPSDINGCVVAWGFLKRKYRSWMPAAGLMSTTSAPLAVRRGPVWGAAAAAGAGVAPPAA